MGPDTFHKIVEPYLLATALTVLILLVTVFLLRRHGRRLRDIDAGRVQEPMGPARRDS